MPEFQNPNIVGNFLQSYYGAQDRTQAQADAQYQKQRQMTQDSQQSQLFNMNLSNAQIEHGLKLTQRKLQLLGGVQPGDVQGLEAAKAQFAQEAGVPLESLASITVDKIPALREQGGQELQHLQVLAQRAGIAAQNASTQHSLAATQALREKPQGGSALAQNAQERAQLAQALGIDPRSDAGKRYILTGQMPNGLTPADRGAVQDADQKVMATGQGLAMLKQARKLSDQSNQGFGANTLAQVPALLGDKSSLNTIDFDNLLQSQVLPQLKTIFGGAPTEGERAILLELQGSSSMSRENRARILDRAIGMANERLKFYKSQGEGIRAGTYYNPGQGVTPTEQYVPKDAAQPAPAAKSLNGWKIEVAK